MSDRDNMVPEFAGQEGENLQRLSRRSVQAVGLFFLILLLSATVFRISGAVIAPGRLTIVETARISHHGGGAIQELMVKEGQSVAEGEILLRLDTTAFSNQAETATLNRVDLLARKSRLYAELTGETIVHFPPELTASGTSEAKVAMARELQMLRIARSDRSRITALTLDQIRGQELTVEKYGVQIDATERQLGLIEDELVGLRELYGKGLVTKNRVNSSERAAIQLEATRAALESNISEINGRIAALRQQMTESERTVRGKAESELVQISRDLAEQAGRLKSSTNEASRGTIASPIAGTVEQLMFRTRGSAIPAGAPIMTIVPLRQARQVETAVQSGDIDVIHRGQSARIILSTSGKTARTELRGTVSYVAVDAVVDERTGAQLYPVRVDLNGASIARINGLPKATPVEVYFVTEERSIMSYLFRPLADQIERAMRS